MPKKKETTNIMNGGYITRSVLLLPKSLYVFPWALNFLVLLWPSSTSSPDNNKNNSLSSE